jgi:hypothetical protein
VKHLVLSLFVLAVIGGMPRTASGQSDLTDYDPYSESWTGLASFKALAEGLGFNVDIRTQLEWGELTANDILFVVYPLAKVEPGKLSAFIQAGGHAVVADDFGDSKDALAALGLLRAEVVTPRASRYQDGRVWAPIALPKGDHELARDIDEVVTNHPAALTQVEGATVILGFDDSAVVVAGVRGTGRFVAVSDPSIFINRMLQYPGNVQLTTNILRWLKREGRAKNVVLLRGEVSMFGTPPPFVDDPRGGEVGRSVADVNLWLSQRREWLLTPNAMKGLAAILATLLLVLAVVALPVRRGPRIDGAWLRFGRPQRRDEPYTLVGNADKRPGSLLVLACVLRDHVQQVLAEAIGKSDPMYALSENQLVQQLATAKGTPAAGALSRVYKRLRALPSRGQAAAPWSTGHLSRREFDALYRDVAELCRTLGSPLLEASAVQAAHEPAQERV